MERNITILIPHKNYYEYLPNAIKSAKNQTYKSFICIIDDGSDDVDKVKEIISSAFKNQAVKISKESYCETWRNNNFIAIFLNESLGPSQARNEGINRTISHTDFYVNLDADDEMYPEKVKKLVDIWEKAPDLIGVVYADYYCLNTTTEIKNYEFKKPFSLQALNYECIVHSGAGISSQALIDSKDEFGFYDKTMRTCEDYDLWMRIAKKYMIVHIPEPLTLVRIQPQNSSLTVDKNIWEKNWIRVHQKNNESK